MGINGISQESLANDGIFAQAQVQEKRLSFFSDNPGRFEEFLGPRDGWGSYEVKSYLVTKSKPAISMYEKTTVLQASEFLNAIADLS